MPLSRLSPRSSRTGVARQKPSSRSENDAQRHLHLWDAIRKTQQEIDDWDRRCEQVDALFSIHIAPLERSLTDSVSRVTSKLLQHFSQTDLDIPDQSLLGLWITDNLHSLQDHPFGDAHKTIKLNAQWLDMLNNDGPVESQLARLAKQHDFSTLVVNDHENTSDNTSRHAADDEHEAGEHMEQPTQADHAASSKSNQKDSATNTGQDNTDKQTPIEQTINELEDKLSIDRLFRQLAKVLHPDREQDEEAKAKKHVLMSECLKARQDNDINALLTLYCEHIGELPDDLNNKSHAELINALETQLKQLQREFRDKHFGDPVHNLIIERYASNNVADCEQRINNHALSLKTEIEETNRMGRQLDDHEGLLDALDERRAIEQDRASINEMTGY